MDGGKVVKVGANDYGPNRTAVHAQPEPAEPAPAEAPERAEVTASLRKAGLTLKRLPQPKEIRQLMGLISSMPAVVHDRTDHAAWSARPVRPALPSPAEHDQLDEALRWVLWLEEDERRIVLAHGLLGMGFRRVAALDPAGRAKSTIERVYRRGIDKILKRLSEGLDKRDGLG